MFLHWFSNFLNFCAQMVEHCETEHTYMPAQIFPVFFEIPLVGKCILALVALVLPFLHCAPDVCVRSDLEIGKCICLNLKLYLSQFVLLFLHRKLCVRSDLKATDAAPLWLFPPRYLPPQTTSTWPSCKLYLSILENVFVKIAKCICLNCPIGCSQTVSVYLSPQPCWLLLDIESVWTNHQSFGCYEVAIQL